MNDNQQRFDDLLFGLRRSVRYHARRQSFYRRCHSLVMFCVLLSGSATIAAFGAALDVDLPLWLKLLPAALSTFFAALDLTFRLTDKAWLHADLGRQFIDLERQLAPSRAAADDKLLITVTDRRLAIEATEPPALRVLDTLCHNELLRAMGYPPERQIPVNWWQRLCAQFVDIREHELHTP